MAYLSTTSGECLWDGFCYSGNDIVAVARNASYKEKLRSGTSIHRLVLESENIPEAKQIVYELPTRPTTPLKQYNTFEMFLDYHEPTLLPIKKTKSHLDYSFRYFVGLLLIMKVVA